MGLLSPLAAGLFAVTGFAQSTASQTGTDDNPQVLEKFEVTGSYLPPAANSVAVPVISVSTKAIENSGNTTNVLEILRKTVPQFSGNANLGSTNANVGSGSTNGGSQLALRNTSTLVLINGRRVAYAPVSASGGYQFVDVNMIPVAAIEKIEVLADGASAIYGTDAVAGVVNIILKTDFEGFEVGGHYGWSTNTGNYAERKGYVVGGAGNGKTSITVSAEWVKEDPIYAYERPYSAVTYGTPTFAGSVNIGSDYYYLDPSLNAPTVAPGGQSASDLVAAGVYSGPRSAGDQFELFNLSQYVTQKIQNERQAAMFAFEHKISDNLRAFGDFMYVNTQTFSQINGQPIGYGGIPAGEYGNPFNVTVTARNRLVDHPRQYLSDTTGIRGVAGLHGKINDKWWWEIAADYNRVTQNYANPGVINNAHLDAALDAGQFNLFARQQDPQALADAAVVGTATGGFVSELMNYDAKIGGTLVDLPAGSLDIAVGGEIRKEFLSAVADPLSQIDPVTGDLGWNGATTLYPFDASRTVKSVFAEVRLPLLANVPGAHLLELKGAIRHESYSDTTNPTVPKIELRYFPLNDEFAIRGTYSKSFSAPQLYSLFGPVSVGFTSPFSLTSADGNTVIDNFQTNYQSGANPDLIPSKSKNYTVGVVYSPKAIKGLSVSIDYWNIKQRDLVSSIGGSTLLQDVEDLGPASQYSQYVRIGGFNGAQVTAPGQISTGVPDDIYVTDTLVNLASVELDGFDISGKYTYNVDTVGRFDFATNIGIYNHYKVVFLPGDPAFETVGLSTDTNGTLPRVQAYTSIDYTRGPYSAFAGWRYVGAVTDYYDDAHIGSWSSFDLAASYTFGSSVRYLSGARVRVGVNNVFNRFGPLDPTVNTDANVDIATYGSIGRMFYVELAYKF